MQLQQIDIQSLIAFVQSEAYQKMPVVPISPQRAFSHAHNPRAQAADVVLVLLYDDKQQMQGYLGVLPDELHFADGSIERVGWLSCMWVNPDLRGQGLSKKLIKAVFEAWNYRILVTEFTPSAKGLYDSTKEFVDLAKPVGLRCYLRPNLAYLLPHRNPKFNKYRGLLRFADACLAIPNALRLCFWQVKQVPTFCYIPEIDDEAWALVQQLKKDELMNRQKADLQWICRYPWLIGAALPDDISRRYHFSSIDTRFNFLNIKIYKNQSLIGFLILAVRGDNLKIPYAYFTPQHIDEVVKVIYKHLFDLRLNMLTVFHPLLVDYFHKNRSPFYKKRPFHRHYIVSRQFEQKLRDYRFGIQDGDADAAFT